jgi:glutaredoxin 2
MVDVNYQGLINVATERWRDAEARWISITRKLIDTVKEQSDTVTFATEQSATAKRDPAITALTELRKVPDTLRKLATAQELSNSVFQELATAQVALEDMQEGTGNQDDVLHHIHEAAQMLQRLERMLQELEE